MKKSLAIVLALIMTLMLVPTAAFAENTTIIYVDANNGTDEQKDVGTTSDKAYKSLDKAMEAANSGDTISLAAGIYCGNSANPTEKGTGAGKNLTFVGAGPDKTTWQIRAKNSPANTADGPCDYSFDGSNSITFKNMTVVGSVYDDSTNKANTYQGFVRINHVKLEKCTFNGYASYWGYETTTFENVTFNAPEICSFDTTNGQEYSLWTRTGEKYTFDNCTFNSSGKVINVYTDKDTTTVTVNFKDCTVINTKYAKQVLNIKDKDTSYVVNISGKNTVTGVEPNKTTCSRLFQVESVGDDNTYYATVNIDGKTVWENGKMIGHSIDTPNDKYTDGYKDNAFTIKPNTNGSGFLKVCNYCGYSEPYYGELYNEIGLKRTVRQNSNSVPEDAVNSNKYKVANSSNITVDYTATMDMENLVWQVGDTRYDKENKYTYNDLQVSPWELLKNLALAKRIGSDTEVILSFKFDDKIDLGAFQTKYNAATTPADKEKLLKLTSNMFEIADEDGVQFDIANRKMTITCKWKRNADTGNPSITLYGYGLPVTGNWGGNTKIDIHNGGCVSGTVHIGGAPVEVQLRAAGTEMTTYNSNSLAGAENVTIQIPIVGGCATDDFTLYYSNSGGHDHYYPTPTPVPVAVIMPKTGDMTIWQSILNLFGLI